MGPWHREASMASYLLSWVVDASAAEITKGHQPPTPLPKILFINALFNLKSFYYLMYIDIKGMDVILS